MITAGGPTGNRTQMLGLEGPVMPFARVHRRSLEAEFQEFLHVMRHKPSR